MRRRILFVVGQLGYGGTERQLTFLVKGLKDRHDVTVVCTSTSIVPFGQVIQGAGVRLLHPRSNSRLARAAWLASIIARSRPDVMLLFSVRNLMALIAALLTRAPVIATERSLGVWKSRSYRAVDSVLYRRCAFVVANSEATRRFHEEHFPGLRGRVHVVPNGIKLPPLPPNDVLDAPHVVFSLVAGFRPWKGHQLLLEAAEVLSRQERAFEVVLVGDGPTRGAIEREIATRSLGRLFTLTGWEREPERHVARAHVNLNVSSHESMSNAVMEGMALGRASIVTDVGGNTELIEDHVTGLVVPPGDVTRLARAMAFMIDNRSQALELGRRARAGVEQSYSVDVMVERMEALICAT